MKKYLKYIAIDVAVFFITYISAFFMAALFHKDANPGESVPVMGIPILSVVMVTCTMVILQAIKEEKK